MSFYIIEIFSFGIATFLLGMLIFPSFIDFLHTHKIGKQIREEATIGKATEFARLHKHKSGTPTMGGVIILFTCFLMVAFSLVLQHLGIINNSLLNQQETYLSLFTLGAVGTLGLLDDILNLKGKGRTKGISAIFKFIGLFLFALAGALWFYYKLDWGDVSLNLTIISGVKLGALIIPLFIFVILGASNSANITDGLDGLAGGLLFFSYCVYTYITFDQGMYLLSALCISIVGALIAFLWFNVRPAKIMMGDVGSLALGANLGIIAMLTNTIFILCIVGIIFIFETISVIIQLSSKKLRNGKKVFIIAPFHHHLEAIGWSEENVVFRLWLLGIIFSIFGIMFYILQ